MVLFHLTTYGEHTALVIPESCLAGNDEGVLIRLFFKKARNYGKVTFA